MTTWPRTLLVEVQRGLGRRLVRFLALVFLAAFALGGLLSFRADSDGPSVVAEGTLLLDGAVDPTPGVLDLVELWPEDAFDPVLAFAAVPLMMAAAVIGASMVGAEWRAGTVTTNLTWEPRRTRLSIAKLVAAGLVGYLFVIALQLAFVALLLPNIAAHGSFDGADGAWVLGAVEGLHRGAATAALVAVGAAALALVGRNTTVALVAGFVTVSILEPVLRAWKPWTDVWLPTTNAARLYLGTPVELSDGAVLTPGRAAVTAVAYLAVVTTLAVVTFVRRDVAATT